MARLRVWLILCCAWLGVPAASAMDETVEVPSRTLADHDFLRGDDTAAPPVTLTGRLSGPDGQERRPVVVVLHGNGGPRSGAVENWRHYLNGLGITTLVLDSYTGRGLTRAAADQGSLGLFVQLYDAYRAADTLAADPRVDGSRMALMGFTRGGTAALYSAMTRFRDAFGPRRATIVAHLA